MPRPPYLETLDEKDDQYHRYCWHNLNQYEQLALWLTEARPMFLHVFDSLLNLYGRISLAEPTRQSVHQQWSEHHGHHFHKNTLQHHVLFHWDKNPYLMKSLNLHYFDY